MGVLLCGVGAIAKAQAVPDTITRRPERVTGRVSTDGGIPVQGAEVFVTRGPDRAYQRDTTDASGRFSISWAQGTGDYLVFVSAPGHKSFRKRVQRAGSADTLLTVDAALEPAVTTLRAVQVRASRPKPDRGGEAVDIPSPGNTVRSAEGMFGALSPTDAGNLSAMAATVPGILGTSGGFSALGLDPTQNQVKLDGLAFAGGDIPREAKATTGVTTSIYDPTQGGFSGAMQSVQVSSGGIFQYRSGSVTLDAPPMQWTDRVGNRSGGEFTNVQASGGINGPLGADDRYYYSFAGEIGRRSADATSLFEAAPAVLSASGIRPDSIAALSRALDQLGIPRAARIGTSRSDHASVLARFDWAPFDWEKRVSRTDAGAITLHASGRRTDPIGASPLVAASGAAQSAATALGVQAMLTRFFGRSRDRLTELRTAFTTTDDRVSPLLALPSASVLVGGGSAAPDSAALVAVTVGGGAAARSRRSAFTWETRSETQWYPTLHQRLKVLAEWRLDGFDHGSPDGRAGSYRYLSLDDLATNRPASFSRTLVSSPVRGGMWSGALALGNFWKPADRFEMVYGARLEGNRYTTRPAVNQEVERRFGVRTDEAPSRVRLSPRAGFTWRFVKADERPGFSYSQLGSFPLIPAGYLRGGIGEFRNFPRPTLLAEPLAATGLPGSTRELQCLGAAVPIPDWSELVTGADLPATCADGAPNFADEAPRVTVIAPGYDAPRSWRANLALTQRLLRAFVTVEGVVSLNASQPGRLPLNLRDRPVAALPGEEREVYVPFDAILPATGLISPSAARKASEFGRVDALVSDLRSTSRQLIATVTPAVGGNSRLSLGYTLGSMRAQFRGADYAAFGDVRAREWARGNLDVRHQLQLSAGHTFAWLGGTSVTLFGLFRSGMPYTPLVSGDLNGDGIAGDRAFVHAPAAARAAGDAELASQMQALLDQAPAHARGCLRSQLDEPARRNGCEGPWSANLNALVVLGRGLVPIGPLGNGRRVTVSLNLSNPLGGLDQLLHGSRLHGWGAPAAPDPVLYTVTGFDPSRQRFRYTVNSRFGSTSPARSTSRAPFRVTLDVRLNLSRPSEEQQVDRFLARGRTRPGTLLDSAALKARYSRNLPSVYTWTLRDADTLLLTRAQVEALEEAKRPFDARLDSLWGQLAGEFARLPRDFDPEAALARQEEFVAAAWELNRQAALRIKEILTPAQYDVVTWLVKRLVETRGRVTLRFFVG